MSDELFDEIEQFLADGGEPAASTARERLDALFAAFAPMAEALAAMVEAFAEVANVIVATISRFVNRVIKWIGPVAIGLRRDQMRRRLEAVRLPRPLARWLANRWPERWLPELQRAG